MVDFFMGLGSRYTWSYFRKKWSEVLIVIALLFVGGIQYLLFLFIIKRFRSMQIPPIWAILIFIPPFNGLCFILAGFSSNSGLFRFLKRLVFPLKEVDHA